MRVTLNRLEFLSAAQDADKIAPANATMDIMRGALLETDGDKLTVAAGNMEVALERRIKADIAEPGSAVINARLLANMLSLLEGDTVELGSSGKGRIELAAGTACYNVAVYHAGDYPRMEIPFPEDTVVVTGIPNMARRTVFAVSEDNTKPLMKCVKLIFTDNGLQAVGSDGFRIAAAKGESKSAASVSLFIPAASLDKLARLVGNKDELQVGTTGKTIVFMKEDFLFSSRVMDGDSISAERLLESVTSSFVVLTDAAALREAVGSATVVTGEQTHFSLSFDGGHIKVRCESESGASTTSLDVVPLSGTPSGVYWYNHNKLMECLRALSGTLMLELCQNGVLLMRTDELVCLQTAQREPKAIVKEKKPPLKKAA